MKLSTLWAVARHGLPLIWSAIAHLDKHEALTTIPVDPRVTVALGIVDVAFELGAAKYPSLAKVHDAIGEIAADAIAKDVKAGNVQS